VVRQDDNLVPPGRQLLELFNGDRAGFGGGAQANHDQVAGIVSSGYIGGGRKFLHLHSPVAEHMKQA